MEFQDFGQLTSNTSRMGTSLTLRRSISTSFGSIVGLDALAFAVDGVVLSGTSDSASIEEDSWGEEEK